MTTAFAPPAASAPRRAAPALPGAAPRHPSSLAAAPGHQPDLRRVDLLRELAELPLVRTLSQPRWHLLCDAPMEKFFLAAGLPADRMTQALEGAEFLEPAYALNCPPNTTLVVATRREEMAVLGVLRRRADVKAMGLFSHFLQRLIAHAPARFNIAALRASKPPSVRCAVIAQSWDLAWPLVEGLGRTGCPMPASHIGAPQILFAEHRALTHFSPNRWWDVLIKTHAVDDAFATVMLWPQLAAFMQHLGELSGAWWIRQMRTFAFLRLRGDLVAAAVADHLAARRADADAYAGDGLPDVLARHAALERDEARLDAWLSEHGLRVKTVTAAELASAEPAAAHAAAFAGLRPNPGQALPVPVAPVAPPEHVKRLRRRAHEALARHQPFLSPPNQQDTNP